MNKIMDTPARGRFASGGKLLMITGDRALAQGKRGAFYYTLEEFSKYWERIDIICPRIQNSKLKIQNLFGNVFVHSSPWLIIFQSWFILKKGKEIFEKERFDLFTIHSYPPFYNDIGGLWLHNEIKVPYISEIHHITGYPKAGSFREWLYKLLTKLLIRFFTGKSLAARVVNQKQTPEFLIKSGVDTEKIKYIPSAYIDLEVFKPLGMEKKYDVIFAGRLAKNKGIMLLLGAIKKAKIQIPNIKMIIIGSGPLGVKIKTFIKNNNLENNIEFVGWLETSEDVARIYNQSKIFIMPSFNEGGPRVNLEAIACKTALITTRVGIMPDIIVDNENGIFIDWAADDVSKKIIKLLGNNNLREKIAESGHITAQQFERKKMIKNYAEAYQNLLHSSGI